MALVMVGAAAGAAWYMARDSEERSSSTPSGSDSSPAFEGPPASSPDEILEAAPAMFGSSGVVDPYAGFAVEDEDGTAYYYDGAARWTAITPDGSMWAIPERSAQLVEEDDGRIAIASSQSDVDWVEEILEAAPGVSRSESGFVVDDYTLYRDGIIEAAAEQSAVVDDSTPDQTRIVQPHQTEVAYVYSEEDHAWVITRDGAVLVLPQDDSLVVAGSIIAAPNGAMDVADFRPAPGYEGGRARDVLMNGKFGTYRTKSSDLVPSSPEGCRTLDEIYADAPLDSDGAMVISAGQLAEACENQPEAQVESRREEAIQHDWGTVWAQRRSGDSDDDYGCSYWIWDCVATATAATPGLLESGYHSTVGRIDDYSICLVGDMVCPDWYWEKVESLWAERDCGSVGPGSNENGKGAPRFSADYPVSDLAIEAGYTTEAVAFAEDRLAIARAWMPRLELSKDEQCGEILRIAARVTAYTPAGDLVLTNLSDADRVEIVYTVFFEQDGGRFGREWHAGDNEGFVIALTRRDPSQGLCRGTEFQFFAGRAVAHKDASGWFQETFHITERHIEDFWAGKPRASGDQPISNPCPPEGPEGGYFLHTAESKHATYYDRDVCEHALIPDSATVLAAFVLGYAVGGVAGPVSGAGIGALSAYLVQKLLDTMPDEVTWQDGLEECEFERIPYDLSNRVELFDDAFASKTDWFDQHFSGRNLGEDRNAEHSFAATARGVVCPSSQWELLDYGGDPDSDPKTCLADDFHVPDFFDAVAASPPGQATISPTTTDTTSTTRTTTTSTTTTTTSTTSTSTTTSIAPATVPVPDVGGLLESAAVGAIEDAGLVAVVAGTIETTDSGFIGRVMDQDPIGGNVPAGSVVRIWIGVATPGGFLDPTLSGEHQLSLVTGFNPDPDLTQFVFFGGSTAGDVSYLGGSCVGYAMARPTFDVQWSGTGAFLRFFFIGSDDADTVMVVRAPDGEYYCNDDSFSTNDPTVTFDGALSGEYQVWIGAYWEGEGGSGDFYVTEVSEYYP